MSVLQPVQHIEDFPVRRGMGVRQAEMLHSEKEAL